MALSGNELDPVIMVAILMSIGLSVDFTAHTAYHYIRTGWVRRENGEYINRVDRLEMTLASIAWPMLQVVVFVKFLESASDFLVLCERFSEDN